MANISAIASADVTFEATAGDATCTDLYASGFFFSDIFKSGIKGYKIHFTHSSVSERHGLKILRHGSKDSLEGLVEQSELYYLPGGRNQ